MAAITQHRPHDALAGRRFGAFSGKTESAGSSHPVGRITQHRPHCGFGGRRFGSFAGKTPSGGTEWDLVAPLELPALSGTLTLAGDLTFSSGSTPTIQSGGGAIVGGKKKRRVGLNYERLRIEQEDALVVDVITALVAAGVI